MARTLTPKRKKFADKYLDTGNGTQAAFEAFNVTNVNSAAAVASRALRTANVQQYLEENAHGAISRIVTLSKKAKNESVKLNANKDIADRAGYGAVAKSESKSLNLNIEGKIENAEAEAIRQKYEAELKVRLHDPQ